MKLSSVFIAAPAAEKDVKVESVSGTTKSLLSYSLKERRRVLVDYAEEMQILWGILLK